MNIWIQWQIVIGLFFQVGITLGLYVDGSVQDSNNSSLVTMELLQACAKPSICTYDVTCNMISIQLDITDVFLV